MTKQSQVFSQNLNLADLAKKTKGFCVKPHLAFTVSLMGKLVELLHIQFSVTITVLPRYTQPE